MTAFTSRPVEFVAQIPQGQLGVRDIVLRDPVIAVTAASVIPILLGARRLDLG